MSQENELTALGISKVLRRNLVVGIILIQLGAIGTMLNIILSLHDQKNTINAELVKCKEEATEMVNHIRLEQIKMIEDMLKKQEQVERELRAANEKFNRKR